MTRTDALQIIKEELYRDTLPRGEVRNALDCIEEYITAPRVTSKALAHIRENTLKEFVEWYKEVLAKDFEKVMAESKIDENRYWYCQGQATALRRKIENIDSDWEKFLEKREK